MGTVENLQNDYTIIVRPERGYNNIGSREKQQKVLQALYDCHACNITAARGDKFSGNIYETDIVNIVDGVGEGQSVFAAFDSQENLENFLMFLIKEDFGLSVVVQGLCKNVNDSLSRVGLKQHTTNHSLGIWGKKSLLQDNHILEVTTMCGHGLVSPYLVMKCVDDVKSGHSTAHDAAVILSKVCICGIFNTTRAQELIEALI
jgi:hypothetical protein